MFEVYSCVQFMYPCVAWFSFVQCSEFTYCFSVEIIYKQIEISIISKLFPNILIALKQSLILKTNI